VRRAARAAVLAALLALAGGCASVRLPPAGTADRAEKLLEEGRAAEAAEAARGVPRGSPDFARAQQLAARATALRARVPREALQKGGELEAAGKLLEAAAAYEAGLVAEPKHQVLRVRLAAVREALAQERERRRFAAERAEDAARLEAERAWAAVVEIDPKDREARRRLHEITSSRRSLAELHLERAHALVQDGLRRDAVEEAELAARLDPGRPATRELLARLREAETAGAADRSRETARVEPRAEPPRAEPPRPEAPAVAPPAPPPATQGPQTSQTARVDPQPPEAQRPDPRAPRRPTGPPPAPPAAPPVGPPAAPAAAAPAPGPPPPQALPSPPAPGEGIEGIAREAIVREALALSRAASRRGDLLQAVAALNRAEAQVGRTPDLASERAAVERLVEAEVQERIKSGIARFQLEDLDGAIAEWGRALELDPANAVALDYRRKAQGMLKRIEEIREEEGRRVPRQSSGVPR
jgi:tetratricopeptide (TPR) repeat protein